MTFNKVLVLTTVLLICALSALCNAQPLRDGHLYDQGHSMTEMSTRAPQALHKMEAILGQWEVDVTTYPTDTTTHTATGIAEISYMNRGYAYMSRIHIPGFDESGNEANLMHFLNFNPSNDTWVLGEASSYTESISMYNGAFNRQQLVLSTAVREGGGPVLIWHRVTYSFDSRNRFTMALQRSVDQGERWMNVSEYTYNRLSPSDEFMNPEDGPGRPSPDRPPESAQFDFLVGEWTAMQNILLNGQWIQFPDHSTAVYALNGHAILEYSWYDIDPSLPDAATTIIRLYNRSMRRWESLYLTNRGNSQLFFGGQKEGDSIVLHNFETNTTAPAMPRYVFHNIEQDTYEWYAESSTDRGKSFTKTWEITFSRKQ